ncbi:uncharacterized protein LOC121304006 [Polyodon spathula]|uniref:uncharacterized protein LOC121304006 n=1 Tax=Polyodon spathula TaxID=7913 RepID=UPI001B7DAE54|nr:uncharacterized protein LOC121304006 [Polyodon spathula]
MLWIFHLAILTVCCRAQLSIHTQPEVDVTEGSTALLPCTFTLGPEERLQSTSVDWENQNNTVIFYHYHHNLSVATHDRVTFVGNISQNNASILLRDVRRTDEGDYLCLVRVGMNMVKNRSELRVRALRARGSLLEVPLNPSPPPLAPPPLWPAVAGGLAAGLVLVMVVLVLILRRQQQDTTLREDQRSSAVVACQDPESPRRDKDTDCYVTLPRNLLPKDPPPLSCSTSEGIYVTMYVNGSRSERGRKGIPEEWCAVETHP